MAAHRMAAVWAHRGRHGTYVLCVRVRAKEDIA
jgi:hypothetical protein